MLTIISHANKKLIAIIMFKLCKCFVAGDGHKFR